MLLKNFLIYPVVALYIQSVEMFLRSHLIMFFYCELQTMNNMGPSGLWGVKNDSWVWIIFIILILQVDERENIDLISNVFWFMINTQNVAWWFNEHTLHDAWLIMITFVAIKIIYANSPCIPKL